MMQRFRSHLSAANVLSMTALVIALGGTAYAATLPKNSVGSKQIKAKAVKNSDLGDSSVTSKKIRNRTLQAERLRGGPDRAGAEGHAGVAGVPWGDRADGASGAAGNRDRPTHRRGAPERYPRRSHKRFQLLRGR